jgi:hypothetical protein
MKTQALLSRDLFLPVAVVEQHHSSQPRLSAYDVASRLSHLWSKLEPEVRSSGISVDITDVRAIHRRVAVALDSDPDDSFDEDAWLGLLEGCNFQDDPGHAFNWIFSSLYWNHFKKHRLATAWMYTSALRVHHHCPVVFPVLAKLGPLLYSLGGSGPPTYDGQTFYIENYSAE